MTKIIEGIFVAVVGFVFVAILTLFAVAYVLDGGNAFVAAASIMMYVGVYVVALKISVEDWIKREWR